MKPKIIAYYLPQYHPTPDNDNWWGKGFTEWTNVGKAKKLYPGHYQPKVPADLGYYDLRVPDVREQQAQLAKDAGVTAFCYYHYWFGNGKQELELPFNEVVASGKPDFPFCLCWANESWDAKFWNKDGSVQKKLLVEQRYLGPEDNEKHFYSLLPAFKDHRYLKRDGKLIFVIYNPAAFIDFAAFKKQWNDLAVLNGLDGFFFVCHVCWIKSAKNILEKGEYDAVNLFHKAGFYNGNSLIDKVKRKSYYYFKTLFRLPFIVSYQKALSFSPIKEDKENRIYPMIIPNWDHTPRSVDGGTVLQGSTPSLFYQHVMNFLDAIKDKPCNDQILFLKSWNEWGEGNYMEPDLKFGRGYIESLCKALEDFDLHKQGRFFLKK